MSDSPAFDLRGLIRGLLTCDPKKSLGAGHEGRVLNRRGTPKLQDVDCGLVLLLSGYTKLKAPLLLAAVSAAQQESEEVHRNRCEIPVVASLLPKLRKASGSSYAEDCQGPCKTGQPINQHSWRSQRVAWGRQDRERSAGSLWKRRRHLPDMSSCGCQSIHGPRKYSSDNRCTTARSTTHGTCSTCRYAAQCPKTAGRIGKKRCISQVARFVLADECLKDTPVMLRILHQVGMQTSEISFVRSATRADNRNSNKIAILWVPS